MSLALYRKYRPSQFAEVRGQERVTTTLQEALRSGLVGHAYIFSGPRGTGKTTVARLLARAVNCEKLQKGLLKSGEPCNTCSACTRAINGKELDLIEIDAASNRGIDEIRELRERVRFAPSIGQKKVFLIDEFHMLTKEAFNALLKTLEEPPAHVIFILATTEIHQVPATIMSRAQHFAFCSLPHQVLVDEIERVAKQEKISASPEAVALLAEQAEGGARDALSLLDLMRAAAGKREISVELVGQVLALPNVTRLEEWLSAVARADAEAALASIRTALEEGGDAMHFARALVRYVRVVLLYSIDAKIADQAAGSLTPEQRTRAQEFAKSLPRKQLLVILSRVNQAAQEIRGSTIASLPLEVATLSVMAPSPTASSGPARSAPAAIPKQSPKKALPKEQKSISKSTTALEGTVKISASDNLSGVDTGLLNKMLTGWHEAIDLIREENLGVAELLRNAIVLKVQDRTAWMVVEYSFHKERILERRSRHLVERILEQRFGEKVRLRCFVPTELAEKERQIYLTKKSEHQKAQKVRAAASATVSSQVQSEPLAELALNLLGGQVVE